MYKEYLSVWPIVGPVYLSTVAICYDVGFFSGIGAGYFTFFSLTEHFLFAIQALPIAALVVVCACYLIASPLFAQFLIDWAAKKFPEFFKKRIFPYQIIIPFQPGVVGAWISTAAVTVIAGYFGSWPDAVLVFSLGGTAAMLLTLALPRKRFAISQARQISFAATVVIGGLVTAWSIGNLRGAAITLSNEPRDIITIGLIDVPATVIRSGDKGIMIKSFATKRITLLRWDAIKRIEKI